MAATWTSTMTYLPCISSLTNESLNLSCRVRTCNKSKFGKEANSAAPISWTLAVQAQSHLRNSKLHVSLVESAQNAKHENDTALLPKRKITKQPHFSSAFLSIIIAKLVSILSYIKGRQCDITLNPFEGSMLQGGPVFRQTFPVRSYEVGTDSRATMEALMNYLQVGVSFTSSFLCSLAFSLSSSFHCFCTAKETALNHCKSMGLLADGFGCTPEMCKRNLVWVIRKMQIVVDTYPLW